MIVLRRILFCGSLPPLIALPRGFFAGACLRLVCDGRRRGSAGWAPWRLREAWTSASTTDLRKSLSCQRFGALVHDRTYVFAWFFPARVLWPPTRGGGWLPGRRQHCGGLRGSLCAQIWEIIGTPREHMPPRLRWELPFIKNSKFPEFLPMREMRERAWRWVYVVCSISWAVKLRIWYYDTRYQVHIYIQQQLYQVQ